MKKLFLGICALLSFFPLLAQDRQVSIKDAGNNQPVPGATIEFADGTVVITNSEGAATIPPRASKATVSSIGYRTKAITIDKGSNTIQLERVNLFLQPVEVRAIRASENAPFAQTNLNARDIEKQNLGQDLTFLLNQTPSVVVNSDAGNGVGYTGIRIRGTDATRINMTLNGIPYNDAESQGLFLVNLPDFASSVSSIQVQRGVGTSSNGAGAFGATLNLSTHDFKESAYGELNNSYGSFNTWKNTVKAGSGLINDHFTIDARLSRISSDGYVDRASSDLRSFYLSTAYITQKSNLRINVISGKEKTYQAWNGVLQSDLSDCRTCNSAGTEKPGAPYKNETDNYRQDHYQLFFNHSFSEKLSINTAGFLTRGLGYYEQYKAEEDYADYGLPYPVIDATTVGTTDLIRQLWLDNYFYGGIYSMQYKQNATQITIGGGYTRYDGDHYGKVIWSKEGGIPDDYKWYDLDAVKTDLNFYGKWQQQFGRRWQSFVDLQYRNVQYDIEGFRNNPHLTTNNTWNFFNPKAGISFTQNNWNAFGSFSIGNKEPNRDDFEAGAEQQPTKETLYDLELGIERRKGNYSWGANFYYMGYRDQLVLTGKVNDVGAYTRSNIDRSYRMGIELQGTFRPTNWFQLSGNMTLSENKVLDFVEYIDDYDAGGQIKRQYDKTDISFSPAITGGATARFNPFPEAEIALIGKYVGRQYLDNTSNRDRSLAPFYVQDLRLRYTVKEKFFREIGFIFQVNNLLDKKYEPNGYTFSYLYDKTLITENYVYPMAGINWIAGVNIKL
jgi:iron complex outermembrane receptor protein